MDTDQPPRYLFTCPQRPETTKNKELRELGVVEETKDDTDPSQLHLVPLTEGAPKVYPFMLDQVGPDFTMAFFGKRREGKSFAMRWILYHLRTKIPRIFVFTNTRLNGFWQQFVPDHKIFDGYSPGVMAKIKEQQTEIVTWMMKHPEEGKKINPYVVVVLEDCMSQDLHHMEQLTDLFFNGRHLKILLMISLQYARGIPPGFRENCDMAVLFRMHSISQIEAICENFLGHLDKKTARNCLEQCVWKDPVTQQRQFLLVDNSGNSPLDHMLYVGQAQDPGKFKFGCKEWWGEDEAHKRL